MKKILKKAKPKVRVPRVIADAEINGEENRKAIKSKENAKGPAEKIGKVVNLIISVSDADRGRTHEEFVGWIRGALDAIPHGEYLEDDGTRREGVHVTETGGYYILDGKVCLPDDYDFKKQNFKSGSTPPSWAGGPAPSRSISKQDQMAQDKKNLTSDGYDQKYGIGKFAPKKPDMSKVITPEMQRQAREERRLSKLREEEEGVEDFEWEEGDETDTKKMSAAADRVAKKAIKRIMKSKYPDVKPVRKIRRTKK